MDKLLTIVIPSYNVEATLRQTVDSLLVPDMQLRDLLDILIVNDGSKDGTLELARQYESENPGVVRVWDKENGGHGSTINVGIDHGYGKYMKVVDGDDWLDTAALEEFLHVLHTTDADVVGTDYVHCYMDEGFRKPIKTSVLPYGQVLRIAEVWNQYTFYMNSLAVKTRLLREQPERIDEHCYYVDVEFDTLVALAADTVLYLDLKLYQYRLQQAGQSVSVEGWMKHYIEHETVALTLVRWRNTLVAGAPEGKIAYLDKRIVRSVGGHYSIGLDFPVEARKQFLRHAKEYDVNLKQQDESAYRLAGQKLMVRLYRATNFSYAAYTVAGKIRQTGRVVKKWLKKVWRQER